MKLSPFLLLVLARGTLSITEELFVETPEGKQLLTGFVVHDEFMMNIENFVGEKLQESTSSMLRQSKVPFVELFSNMEKVDYILIQIIHALSTKDFMFLSFLLQFTQYLFKKDVGMESKSYWLRKNVGFPSDEAYRAAKSLVTAGRKGLMADLPPGLLAEILQTIDASVALTEASVVGDVETVEWLLKSHIEYDSYSAVEKAFANERTDILKLLIANGALDDVSQMENLDLSNNSSKGETLLHFAAQSHRPKAVAALLQAGEQPNVADAEGYTPLHRAVESNEMEAATLLVKNGALINEPTPSGDLPIHLAVSKGNLHMSRLLIKLGSSLDERNKLGLTPLYLAENTVVAAIVRYIEDIQLKKKLAESSGSDENHGDHYVSPSPLSEFLLEDIRHFVQQNMRQIYCHENDIQFITSLSEIVNLFLRKGEVSRLSSHLQLFLSIKAGGIEDEAMSEILVNLGYKTPEMNIQPILDDFDDLNAEFLSLKENINFKNETGYTYLHTSAAQGDFKAVKMLLKRGADIEATTNISWTPLHFAASEGREDIVNLLIQEKAKVNAKTTSEEMPLHLASKNGHADIVRVLLKNGAEINAETYPDCFSPLYLASREGHLSVVEVLVAGKAYIDAKDCADYNLTPLQVAALWGHVAIVEYLSEHGADVDARDKHGVTALYTAAWNGVEEVVSALLRLGANVRLRMGKWGLTALHGAAARGHAKVVEVLLRGGAPPNSKDYSQDSPLHWAAAGGYADVVRAILRRGGSVDPENNGGYTPLHKAAANGHVEVIRILSESGADVDAKTVEGKTPAYEAVFWNQRLALKTLVENGANIYIVGPDRQTILNFALRKGMVSITNG